MLGLLVAGVCSGRAQQLLIHNYALENGLPHNNVFSLFQDRRGFIWFTTSQGLSRFDGRNFRNYGKEDGLPNPTVLVAAADEQGGYLLCTYGGGLAILRDSGIIPFPLVSGAMPGIALSAGAYQDMVWLIAQDSVNRLYRIRDGHLSEVPVLDEKGQQCSIFRIVRDGDELLVTAKNNVYRITQAGGLRPLIPAGMPGIAKDIVRAGDSSYWIGFHDRLVLFREGNVVRNIPFAGKANISDLLRDRKGNIWVGTISDGIYRVNARGVVRFKDYLAIPPVIITDMLEDEAGSIWLTTQGKGVYRLDDTNLLNYYPGQASLNVSITALEEHKDTVIIGSTGTLSLWHDGKIVAMPSTHLNAEDFIYFIRRESARIYIGTPYALISKQMTWPFAEKLIKAGKKRIGCISLFTDSHGRTWAGSFGRLFLVEDDTLRSIRRRLLHNVRINAIGEDTSGIIYFGSNEGLIAFDGRSFSPLALPAAFRHARVNALYGDSLGRLWIATADGLLLREKAKTGVFAANGRFAKGGCTSLAADSLGNLWVGTADSRVSKIILRTMAVSDYALGEYSGEVTALKYCHNRLFIGLADKLSVIANPTAVDAAPPPLYITAIRSGRHQIAVTDSIRLAYSESNVSVDYAAISYRYPQSVRYRYRIEGLESYWHYTSGTTIDISAIPFGSCQLILAARQSNGPWGPPVRLHVYVTTPIWRQWWFATAFIIILSALVFATSRYFVLRKARRQQYQRSVSNRIIFLKQQALSALINPHFIFNCMNSIQHYLNRKDSEKANEYLADFASLIRLTMEQAQQAFISLKAEVARLQLYLSLEKLRFGDQLLYDISIDPELEAGDISIPNMILQPYVENAIWHGIMPKKAKGYVSVTFSGSGDGMLQIEIRDDGIGFHHRKALDRPGVGFGMGLTERRLQLLADLLKQEYSVMVKNIEAQDSFGKSSGTLIVIRVPLKPDIRQLHLLSDAQPGT
jgi:hypothetical protein